jgi:WD40 repeat protein
VDVDSGEVSLSLPASDGVAAFLTGNRMAVASLGSTVVSVYALDGDGQTPLLTKNGLPPGGGLVVSPDGKSMMVGGLTGTAQLVDAATLEPISSVYSVRGSRLGDLFFSPDSRYVGLGSDDGSIRFFDLQLDVQVMEVTGLTGLVTGGFVGDTSFLIASFTDELVVVGDLTDLTQIGTSAIATNSVSGVVALTDDRELVSTGQAGSQIGPRGKPPTAHSSFTGSVRATSVNADQSKAAMYVIEADPETGEATSRDVYVVDLPDFTVQQTISFGDTAVENLALSPDGSLVAVGQRDGSLSVYDAISGEQVLAPRQIDVYPCCLGAVVWSPDGSRLYVGGQDGTLRALDAADWSVVGEVVLAPDRSALRITRWSPDGTMLIVPCECGSVFLVDPDAMTVIGEPFTAAGTQLQNAVLIDDQQRLVAISRDGSMRLWDVATHRSIGPAMRAHTLFALALDKESETEVVSGGAVDGIVTHWTFDPKEWVARACEVAGRNLTKDEWDRYVGDDYHATCEQFPDGT